MRIGLAYDLKEAVCVMPDSPEDALEEYDSRDTVEAIAGALNDSGHSVAKLGGGMEFLSNIVENGVDLVFNIAEGRGNHRSREAQVPSVLEMLGVPYTGSDPQCLAICLDKPLTKNLVAMAGVPTPRWRVIATRQQLRGEGWNGFPFPVFIKLAHEGSSKGIGLGCRAQTSVQAADVAADLMDHYGQPVIVEEFIAGEEVTVGVIGNSPPRIIGTMRVVPRRNGASFVYSLEVKRDWQNLVDYECPAELDERVLKSIADCSLKTFDVLGCHDIARIDFRISSEGVPYFLEINPLPGLSPGSSDLPIMARKMGWTYQSLISTILNAAVERYHQCSPG